MRREDLDHVTTSAPWLLAARVVRPCGVAPVPREHLLTWPQLWDVLRWYAHNRGYDGNRTWARTDADAAAAKEDTEKEKAAIALMEKHGTDTMAETFCKELGVDPDGPKRASMKRIKGLNVAFPRSVVMMEVSRLIDAHKFLPGINGSFLDALMHNWKAIPCAGVRLPARYEGGILFGQLVPRFENRIIATCPIAFQREYDRVLTASGDREEAKRSARKLSKVPNANCGEYFRYRWLMQVANILVHTDDPKKPRRLSVEERNDLDRHMQVRGALTKTEFIAAVEAVTKGATTNVKHMMLHPDAERALVVDPARREVTRKDITPYFALLPAEKQKRIIGRLRRGVQMTLATLRDELAPVGDPTPFDAIVQSEVEKSETRRGKKANPVTPDSILSRSLKVEPVNGRAPHTREVMRDVAEYVLTTDRHPAEEGGPLYRSEAIREAQLQRAIDEQTNNHLVRHRLRLLDRLHADILQTYAGGQKERIRNVTIEVNRELKELSGSTAKQIAQELGGRLANFKSVAARLERDLAGSNIAITPGLIRKARIAEDLGWRCPYTGALYDAFQLASGAVDKDHIIPRSQRASDSLDSLVITFGEVNRMKGRRTAAQFIEECQGKPVDGAPHLSIKSMANFTADVESLETFKGHEDDKRRKRNRKRLLLIRDYVEKEFTPRDLTQTSQLTRLAAEALSRTYLTDASREGTAPIHTPVITSLSGSVTGSVRRSWNLLGCLQAANSQVIDPATGDVRTKTEIRDITHLHHALDAAVLAFARQFLPRDGGALELLVKRRLNSEEQSRARRLFGDAVSISQSGELRLAELPAQLKQQLRERLAERRVVQHIPREMSGMRAELNAWRVVEINGDDVTLRQRVRQPNGSRPLKEKKEKRTKLVGLKPGKLQRLKAALVIADNYGLALDPEPTIIPFHHVWKRLAELKAKNGGKAVRILRTGALIQVTSGRFAGVWRIFSVKNNASGIAVNIGRPDVIRLQNKTDGHRFNVLLASLIRDGLTILEPTLCGTTQ